jgi:hypothetical protein
MTGVIVSAWTQPESVVDMYSAAIEGDDLSNWDQNGDDWKPEDDIDELIAEYNSNGELTAHEDTDRVIGCLEISGAGDDLLEQVKVALGKPECPICSAAGVVTAATAPHPETGELICLSCHDQITSHPAS